MILILCMYYFQAEVTGYWVKSRPVSWRGNLVRHGGFSVPFIWFHICTSEPDNFTVRRNEAIFERALTLFGQTSFMPVIFIFQKLLIDI